MSVTIERLGHKGEGIAPGTVFVPGALPGEIVEGDIVKGRLEHPKIQTPSPDRVRAPCPHYKRCGGCNLQHARDEFVEAWKVERVTSALSAHGIEARVRSIHTSPPSTRRRAVFSGRRLKKGVEVGFHTRASDQVVPVPDCLVLRPTLLAARDALGGIVSQIGSRKGELRLMVTDSDTGLDVSVSGAKPLARDDIETLVGIMANADIARLVVDGEIVATRRQPTLRMGQADVPLPPGAFLQATAEGEAALVGAVSDALDGAKGSVADLFAGVGTFALPLAGRASVHAVEGLDQLTGALDKGWRHAKGLRQVTTETRDLFRRPLLVGELQKFGGVVVDPPRAGAEAQTREIAEARVPFVAMVSCNPITFARDAAILMRAGYELDWVDVVDQFRWSAHVELAARFRLPKT